jgi:hypothetical protein
MFITVQRIAVDKSTTDFVPKRIICLKIWCISHGLSKKEHNQ